MPSYATYRCAFESHCCPRGALPSLKLRRGAAGSSSSVRFSMPACRAALRIEPGLAEANGLLARALVEGVL